MTAIFAVPRLFQPSVVCGALLVSAMGCGRLGFDYKTSPTQRLDGGSDAQLIAGDGGVAQDAQVDGSVSADGGLGDGTVGDGGTGDAGVGDAGVGDAGAGADGSTDGSVADGGSSDGGADGSADGGADGGSPMPPDILVMLLGGTDVTEGGTAVVVRFMLQAAPTADVTVGLTSSDTTEGTVSSPSVTFTSMDWSSPHDVTVSPVDDSLIDGDQIFNLEILAATSADMAYNGMDAVDVAFTNHDDEIGVPVRITMNTMGGEITAHALLPQVSSNGQFIVFQSDATDLVTGDTNGRNDVFLYDRSSGNMERVSRGVGGVQGDNDSYYGAVSATGRYVAFASRATNLVPMDTNNTRDVFLLDRTLDTVERVSVATGGAQGDGNSHFPTVSADGRYISFRSSSTNLVAGDTNGVDDIFLRDRQMATTIRITEVTGSDANGAAQNPDMDDGTYVAYETLATNVVMTDTNTAHDVYLYEISTGITTLLNESAPQTTANGMGMHVRLSPDGSWAAFSTSASNITGGLDMDSTWDIHTYETGTGTREVASLTHTGAKATQISQFGIPSDGGDRVVFLSTATNLTAAPDTNGTRDIFVRDKLAGTTVRLLGEGGVEPDANIMIPDISADGTVIVFNTTATNMVSGDTNGVYDIFVYQLPR